MREINKISEALFEKIRDRFEDVSLGDENAKATQNPEEARFFNFDYVVDGHNYGNITISVIDEISLKVYFSKNISKDLDNEQQQQWYSFLRELREFAKRNLLSFEPRDITRSTLKHRDLQQVSKADDTYSKNDIVSEGRMYGTMTRSYEDFGPVRIKVAHAKPIVDEANRARSRNIEAVFVENDQGERFRMPFESLIGTRAMARHISAGGTPTDVFGQHITEMVNEMMTLRPFVHSMRHRTFEDATTNDMLESAFEYHGLLKNTLKKMKGKRGYNEYKESYEPTLTETDDFDENEIKEKFVKKVFPSKLEAALPIVHKAHQMKQTTSNKYAEQFESWADDLAEGSWAVPETESDIEELIELMKTPLEAGVDGENASNALYNLLGDDELFDNIDKLAQEQGPEVDVREVVFNWIEENLPEIAGKIEQALTNTDEVAESESGDTPIDNMTRAELLDYLNASPEDVMNVSDDELRAAANERAESLPEGNTYGASGMDEPNVEEGYDEQQVEEIQSAIIRRILGNINQHSDLLRAVGPDGVMNAARDVASFHAPVEELGSSDISIMVREVYQEAGVDYPEMNENVGDDYVNKDVKMKRMGAKPLGMLDKLKTIPQGIKAMAKGDSEDDLVLYNKSKSKVSETSDQEKLERYHELIKQGMDPDDAEVEVFNDEGDEDYGLSEMRRLAGL